MLGGVEVSRESARPTREASMLSAVGAAGRTSATVQRFLGARTGPGCALRSRSHVGGDLLCSSSISALWNSITLPVSTSTMWSWCSPRSSLVDRLPALEIVLEHQAGRLELGQHPVNRRQADIVAAGRAAGDRCPRRSCAAGPAVSSSSRIRMRGWVTFSPTLRRSCDSMDYRLVVQLNRPVPVGAWYIIPRLPTCDHLPMRKALVPILAAVLMSGCMFVHTSRSSRATCSKRPMSTSCSPA